VQLLALRLGADLSADADEVAGVLHTVGLDLTAARRTR
jgi:hypothetical protein